MLNSSLLSQNHSRRKLMSKMYLFNVILPFLKLHSFEGSKNVLLQVEAFNCWQKVFPQKIKNNKGRPNHKKIKCWFIKTMKKNFKLESRGKISILMKLKSYLLWGLFVDCLLRMYSWLFFPCHSKRSQLDRKCWLQSI